MLDQADDLRQLVVERARPKTVRTGGRPTLLALTGGKGGVGTTTAAISLATSLSQIGKRTLLLDADPRGGDVALRCGVEEKYTLADLLAGRRAWAEVIESAPRGIQVVAGARWSAELGNRWSAAAELLVELLNDPELQTDVAVIDVGNHPGRAGERLCRAADAVVVVTTCETAAVISTFEAIKSLSDNVAQPGAVAPQALHLMVNMARSARDAASVRHRLGRACRRMLGIDLMGMDLTGNGLPILGTAALFACFPPLEPTNGQPAAQTGYFDWNR